MMKKFKFFDGFIESTYVFDLGNYQFHQQPTRNLRVRWEPETEVEMRNAHGVDITEEISRLLSEELDRTIEESMRNTARREEELVNGITRRLNSGSDYLNHWLSIGEDNNRA